MRLSRRCWLIALGLGLGLVGLTWRLWAAGTRGAEIANVLALPVSVVGALLTLVAWLRPSRPDTRTNKLCTTVDDLADTISGTEAAALIQLLDDVGDPHPANLTFDRMALVQWRNDGGSEQGNLAEISDYYQRLERGRLVILGDPGAGKTVLAVHLIRELLRKRLAARSISSPVPVRVSLSSFNPFPGGEDLDEVTDQDLVRRFDAWLSGELVGHNVRRRQAIDLVRRGWILPVLDGLNEMDSDTSRPRRAAAVIRALNATARPVVLTSQRHRYNQLLHTSTTNTAHDAETPPAFDDDEVAGSIPTLPQKYAVQDATTVVLNPLDPAVVRDYLVYLFPDPTHPSGIAAHWRATYHALNRAADPNTGSSPADPLVTALRSPWLLYLCRTAFADAAHGDPYQQLAGLAPGDLTDELMRRLIPAAVERHPRADGRRYHPDQVTTWLTTLARHLQQTGQRGGSSSDILLHELWRAAGPRIPRYVSAAALALFAALFMFMSFDIVADGNAFQTMNTGLVTAGTGLVAVMTGYVMTRKPVSLTRFDLNSLATRRGRRQLTSSLAIVLGWVLTSGLIVGFEGGLTAGLGVGLGIGPGIGLMLGVANGLRQTPSVISAPRELVRQGLTHDLGVTVGTTVAVGLGFGLTTDIVIGHAVRFTPMLSVGFMAGLAVALMVGFGYARGHGISPSPWPRYLVAMVILRHRKALPFRLARFLDWAYAAGLMRLSGVAIQFRHDTFRTWLTREPTTDLKLTAHHRAPAVVTNTGPVFNNSK